MSVVIRLVSLATPTPTPHKYDGCFLVYYDPDRNDGRGWIEAEEDPDDALTFASAEYALAAWRETSLTCPLRDDGQPNRPLTAWTIEVLSTPPGVCEACARRAPWNLLKPCCVREALRRANGGWVA